MPPIVGRIAFLLAAAPARAAPTLDIKGLGAPAQACADFDDFVNGAWRNAVTIPPLRGRIGTFDRVRDESRAVLERALADATRDPKALDTQGKRLAATIW